MRLRLIGHDYKYDVEQIMLMMFPGEKPVYTENESDGLSAEVVLSVKTYYAQATTSIYSQDGVFRAFARIRRGRLTSDELESARLLKRIIKKSFFRAAVKLTGNKPVWGSLTGIRPAKLAAELLEEGVSERAAAGELIREYRTAPARAQLCVSAAKAAAAVKQTLSKRDIALYVGIPFCPTRCAYCSFVSNSVEKSFRLIEPFTEALLRETEKAADAAAKLGLRVCSVYIGGGTPTALPAQALDDVMRKLSEAFDLSAVREYTVEAGRPDTITREKLDIIIKNGATRVSVNPQSMSAEVLSAIGRSHAPGDVLEAVRLVREHGGLSLNMDLIAGLPADTVSRFCASLDAVLSLSPENVTVHTLSLKKGARIMLEGTPVPDGEAVCKMLDYASEQLRVREYSPYYLYRQKFTSGGFENVGWSLGGYENLYNICMMEELCTVLALGGGGVTKLVSGGRIERCFNAKYPQEYIERPHKIAEKISAVNKFYSEI